MSKLNPIETARMILDDPEMFEDFIVDAAHDLLDAYANPCKRLEQASQDLHLALNAHI
jgi:hypothetical protein